MASPPKIARSLEWLSLCPCVRHCLRWRRESVDAVPVGPQWQYEPKWDGFRCLLFREGDRIELQSKAERSLTRYFPDIVAAAKDLKADRFVLDGELVVPVGSSFSFDDLLQRIHLAQSRVALLAKETPALLIVFDLLVDGEGDALAGRPLAERRAALEVFAHKHLQKKRSLPVIACDASLLGSQELAQARRQCPRWRHRQASRPPVPRRKARRRAKDQEPAQRRLRGRWLSI